MTSQSSTSFFIDGDVEYLEGIGTMPGTQANPWTEELLASCEFADFIDVRYSAMVDRRNDSIKKYWTDEDRCAEHGSKIAQGYANRDEETVKAHRHKQSAALKAAYADPELRRLHSERKKAWWAARKRG